jgi:hypothetical protein
MLARGLRKRARVTSSRRLSRATLIVILNATGPVRIHRGKTDAEWQGRAVNLSRGA